MQMKYNLDLIRSRVIYFSYDEWSKYSPGNLVSFAAEYKSWRVVRKAMRPDLTEGNKQYFEVFYIAP